MAFILSILLFASADETELKDGETYLVQSESILGSEKYFKFSVGDVSTNDLVFSLTTYADNSDPDMLVKVDSAPTFDNYDFESLSWGSGSIIITPLELKKFSTYYTLVLCYTVCRYGITVSYAKEVSLIEGVPISNHLESGRQAVYLFSAGPVQNDTLTITLSATEGLGYMYVIKGKDSEITSDNSEFIDTLWDGSLQYKSHEYGANNVYKIAVMAEKTADYTIVAKSSKSIATMIQASVPISGEVATGDFNYYYIRVLSPTDSVFISLTMLTGDADIYVRAVDFPNLLHFNFSSRHIGNENLMVTKEDRAKIGSPTGNYYIGIYGYQHSAYVLTVTTSNSSFVQLKTGIPQSGSVMRSAFVHFYLEFPEKDTNISIALSAASGNPDLFVRLCKSSSLYDCAFNASEFTHATTNYSSRHSTGSDLIEIAHKANSCSGKSKLKCNYVIAVYGAAEYSTYTLTAITNNSDEIVLQDGKPLMINLPEYSGKLFKFTVFNTTVERVDCLVSPVYGDMDLYGSFNAPIQDLSDLKSSTKTGLEIDQIYWTKGIDSDSLVGTYHLLVGSWTASSFTILAKTMSPDKNTTIQIFPGHPQKDTVYNFTDRDYRIYSFPVHSQGIKQTITISLTALTGKFNLYAANSLLSLDWSKEIFYYNWKTSDSNHSDMSYTITISPDDPSYLNDSTYLILVMAEEFMADKSATYVISYSVEDGSVLLSEDIPYTGVVLENDFSYFVFPVHFSHEDITVSLTTISGDPDLFISVDPNNTRPNQVSFDFKSTTFGDEKITLTWEEGLKLKCPNLPSNYTFGNSTHCNLYIGVYGIVTTTYTIRVHPSKGLPLYLGSGQPTRGEMKGKEYLFYYSFAEASKGFKIVLQADQGDSDLFLNVIDRTKAGNNITQWDRPNKEKSDFSSQSTVMNEEIKLSSKQLYDKCGNGTCLIVAAVLCYSKNCTFYVQVGDKNETQNLVENQPTYGYTNKEMVYFSYYSNQEDTNFLVTVTTLGYCNPDLYITKGRNSQPTLNSSDWNSTMWGGDSILITKNDPFFNGKSMKGTYKIGVIDQWDSCSFSLLINNNPKPVSKLISGIPQFGNLTAQSFNYYVFSNYIQEDILITLTPTYGLGKLYVLPKRNWDGDVYANLPGPDRYTWGSDTSKDRYMINITTTDSGFCTYCDYIIAIKTEDLPVVYSLTAKNHFEFTVLQDGQPVRAESSNNRWSVFSFEVNTRVDFDISVTSYSSHPNLFVTTSKDMEYSNYNWTAYYIEGTQTLRISRSDENYKLGIYYIVVYAYDSAIFSIVANSAGTPVTLVDGWPLSYSLTAGMEGKAHFKYTAFRGHMVFCSVKSFGLDKPTVYTKFQSPYNKPQIPSKDAYQNVFRPSDYIDSPGDGSLYSAQLYINLPHLADTSQLNIGLYSFANFTNSTLFQIHCSSSTQTTTLRLGSVNIEVLDNDTISKQYELFTPKKGTLQTFLVPCLGEFKLEISSNWTVIKNDDPDVSTSSLVDGMLVGSVNNAKGNYYITVSGKKQTNSLKIYELFSTFTESGKTPPSQAKPGNNGLITWTSKGENNVEISWTPLEDDSGQPYGGNVTYKVYFTTATNISMISACTIHCYNARQSITLLGSTNENSLTAKIEDHNGFVNVVAYLHRELSSPVKQVVYDPTEVISYRRVPRTRSLVIFWVLLALLVVTTVAAYYFYKKHQTTKNRLAFEMSDVRNVGNISQVELPKRYDPYSSLSNP